MSTSTRAPRLTSLVVAGAVLGGLLLSGTAASARPASGPVAATVGPVGWWTDRPGATATEEGGFEVAADGAGEPQSVAAVQLDVDAERVDRLAVTLTESSAVAEFASITVCRTDLGWIGENPGALDDAPAADCSTRVDLARSADAGTWQGDLAPLVREGGRVSLALLPEYRPPTPIGTGMVVRVAEIAVEATGAEGTDDPPTTTSTPPAPPSTAAPAIVAPPTTTPAPTRDAPASFGGPPPPAPPTTVAVADGDAGAEDDTDAEAEEGFFTLGPVEPPAGDAKPWARLVLLVPLSAALGAGAVRVRRLREGRTQLLGSV